MEEARQFVMPEKEGKNVALSGEVIMKSVRSPEEEVNFYNPVPVPILLSVTAFPHWRIHGSRLQ